jgi:phosphopantothenate-cysteine ligase
MNILITAGGNTEKIDDVRMIRNTGTGRLGALVAQKLLAANPASHIYYICDRHAAIPVGDHVTVLHADDVTSLGETVRRVCSERRIDAVVHSMAVSDYRVKNVTTAAEAAKGIERARDVRDGGKISSNLDDILVVLERAPKIISLYRDLVPDSVIVGFKLLSDVTEEELVRVGYELLGKNDCDYVLANDMQYLSRGEHIGHLIARDGSYSTYDGKDAIAGAIAAVLSGSAPWQARADNSNERE